MLTFLYLLTPTLVLGDLFSRIPMNKSSLNATETKVGGSASLSFLVTVAEGISRTKEDFPDVQIFRVVARSGDYGPQMSADYFQELTLEMSDRSRRDVVIENSRIIIPYAWNAPRRVDAHRPIAFDTFAWSELGIDIDDAFEYVNDAGYKGPWSRVEVFKYDIDSRYPRRQIYYFFATAGNSGYVLLGTKNYKVYAYGVENQVLRIS